MTITNNSELDSLVARVAVAQKQFSTFTQEQVDVIFRAAAMSASDARIQLAQLAFQETGMGVVEDKVVKNHFASEYIYNKYKDERTCDVLEQDDASGTITIAAPIGVICGIIPVTNPTSTTIFKALISIKTRNGIVFSPHPRASRCACEAARIVLEAAVAAGAPADIIGWIEHPTLEISNTLMRHPGVDMILATGGQAMVRAAYSSGKPAIGVGAGNTPVIIDGSADIKRAVASILLSKTFDNGMICASEQAVIVVDEVYAELRARFADHGGYILSPGELESVRSTLFHSGAINTSIVGQSALCIAGLARIQVPADTKVLLGEVTSTAESEPLAHEKLSPVLALYRAHNFNHALQLATELVALGGFGHTSVLFTDQDRNSDSIALFGAQMKTARILINTPSSHGGIGDLYNFSLAPSLTLGCGSWGGNSISENVGPKHLINRKTVAKRAENMLWHKVPKFVYFRRGAVVEALKELQGLKRALVVTDTFLFRNGNAHTVIDLLKRNGMEVEVFFEVEADPTLEQVRRGTIIANSFLPDVIVAFGGGSPMDAAKILWIMYEHPEVHFEDIAMRFMDIRKRIFHFPKMGIKAQFIAIPTTSGTGSEVTPFAVVTDEVTGTKYPIADYELMPTMAIVDANFVMNLPRSLTAAGGLDAITHAIESYVSIMANEFTDGQALHALHLLKEYLPSAYEHGANDPIARERVHSASTIAGIAFANSFLGVCHSMAHKLGSAFHITHGIANALLLTNVIRYNANDNPAKQAAFSQYDRPKGKCRYAEIATYLGLAGVTNQEKVESLIKWFAQLSYELGVPESIQAYGIPESEFLAKVDAIALGAFDDQCTGANPRFPLIKELRAILLDSYYGRPFVELFARVGAENPELIAASVN